MRSFFKYVILFIIFFVGNGPLGAQENNSLLCSDGIDNDGDGAIDCDDQECTVLANDGCRTCFNDGLSFADVVIEYVQFCGASNQLQDPILATGVSDHFGSSGRFLALGNNGWVKLGFTNNLLVNSGNANPDLWVFEIGLAVEATFVELQPADPFTLNALTTAGILDSDGDGYFEFGRVAGATSAIDIEITLPGFTAGELKFDAVKLLDDNNGCGSGAPGADIDAICALSSIPNEICGNGIDDDLDGLTDCDDPDLASMCCCIAEVTLELGDPMSTCVGDTIELFPNATFETYQWQDGSRNASFNATSTGNYSLTVTDINNCEFVDVVLVSFLPLPQHTQFYRKCAEQEIMVNGISRALPGIYVDTVDAINNCDTIIISEITNFSIATNYLGPDTTSCAESVRINSLFPNTTWSDGSVGNSYLSTQPELLIAQSIDTNLCQTQDTVRIDFIRIGDVFMPNAFSPNNDGINDVLRPFFESEFSSEYTLTIFDRWGNKLTDISGRSAVWNGTTDGKPALNGVYLWRLNFINTICGTPISRQGDVLLTR